MSLYIGANNVVVQNVQIHWLKNTEYLFLQSLLDGGACSVSLNVLIPNVASGANVGRCTVHVGWGPSGGLWACPKCWDCIRCWGNHSIVCVGDDEA
jgi:hypothetical protein